MLIIDPKIYTVPQYRHPHVQPESVPGCGSRSSHQERGWGHIPLLPAPGTPGWGWAWAGGEPWPCCPEEVWLCQGGTGSSGGSRIMQGRAEGLMQGRCCQAALWLCQHSKVSWHKTHGKDLSQQSTTNSRCIFLVSPKISQPFCSSCLLGLENTSIFNLKDILIICFPF